MKEIISIYAYDSYYPENKFPYNRIHTTNFLYKITNGEYIGAYGDLYVIEQSDYSSDGELIGLNMLQSYDSMLMKKKYEYICNNRDVIDHKFISLKIDEL